LYDNLRMQRSDHFRFHHEFRRTVDARRRRRHTGGLPRSTISAAPATRLAWWRRFPVECLTGASIRRALDESVAALPAPGNATWLSARAGAAPAAISLAFRAVYATDVPGYALDTAMTMLLVCVLDGDRTADLVYAFLMRRLARSIPALDRHAVPPPYLQQPSRRRP
jgi:hypothetical protein